jgi:uncharacterized protein YjbI with pentapeptide repeats
MADEKQLERLLRSVEEWNQWREENLRIEIELRGAKLFAANLTGADLYEADLRGANLARADLYTAILNEANLYEADLSEADLRGANLSEANLSEANLSEADLRGATLTDANLSEANLRGANLSIGIYLSSGADLTGADLTGADLSDANLSDANLSDANLSDANLSDANLNGANLSDANLNGANLSEANLSGANLSGANLSGANLSKTNALKNNFTRANLTGAYIQDWHINQRTIFEEVICDYIYYKIDEEGTYQDRRPHDPHKIFNPGDFQRLIETARETIDLIFSDGIDWKAFLESFHGLQIESENGELSIAGILKKRDGTFVIQIDAPQNTDKAELENRFYQVYEQKLALIEQNYQAQLANKDQEITNTNRELQIYRKQSSDMTEIAKLLATRPMTIEAKAVSYGEIKQAGNFGVGVNQGEIQGNAKIAGILNEAEQQNLTEIITEVQAIITPLAQTYPNDKTMQGIKTIEVIKNDPNLKQKLINAAQKGGLEFLKKSFDNPVGALIGGAIEGWMGK